jgi:hypothetical protein
MFSIASAMLRRALTGSSKGNHGLAFGAPADGLVEGVGRRQVNIHTQEIVQAVLDSNHVEQRQPTARLKLGDQVDVGVRGRFPARDGGMETQVNDSGRPQFRPMCPELLYNLRPLHTSTLP